MQEIDINQNVMDDNDRIALEVNGILKNRNIFCVNMISSPGAGKTTFLERILKSLKNNVKCAVIEGDMTTTIDRDRLLPACDEVYQINTDTFGGDCHLSAFMIKDALTKMNLSEVKFLIIENVGNLICPADFLIGEDQKIVLYSVTEGEDKPLKYPVSFNVADIIIVTKTDLLPHLDVNKDKIFENIKKVNSRAEIFFTSAKTGEGIDKFVDYIKSKLY